MLDMIDETYLENILKIDDGLIRSSIIKAIQKLRFGNLELVNSDSDS